MDDSSFKAMAEEIEGLLGIDQKRNNSLSFSTKAVHGYRSIEDGAGAISQPIYQSATFGHPALHQSTGFAYSRCGNPTVLELENTIAMLEGGLKALAFCSGMAAISCIIKLFEKGDVVLVGDDLYGGLRGDIPRQALHCGQLSFREPLTGELITVTSELPEDIKRLFDHT